MCEQEAPASSWRKQRFEPQTIQLRQLALPDKPRPVPAVTGRQREVIRLVALGLPTKDIAHRLGVSEAAIKKHLAHSMSYYDVPNRAALVRACLADGIIGLAPDGTVTSG